MAYVVATPGSDLVAEELIRWAADRLAPAKRPRAVHLVEALPRTSVGKIRKFLLQADQPADAAKSRPGAGPAS